MHGLGFSAPSQPLPRGARPSEREMETAREVQARLLPRRVPQLMTLECAGLALPARGLGGDHYDFLKPSPRRLAIALGDISGKGVPAALMVASLQASLRSHYAAGVGDLARRLESINRLFHETTAIEHFATLFLGEYDDRTRRLRYANCGHVPPLLLRGDGSLERLEPTAPLLGSFECWKCSIADTVLLPGDTLLIYSDGATEATNGACEQFGEQRLASVLRASRRLPLQALLEGVVDEVRRFGGGEPADDLTLVVARPRTPPSPDRLQPERNGHMTSRDRRGESHADLHPPR
jgi:serine phosphatase RsbU (regulator of sigma subunit)